MELMLLFRAAQDDARNERRDEAVPFEELRSAVSEQNAGERDHAGLCACECVVARNAEEDLAEQPTYQGTRKRSDGDAINAVAREPLEPPRAGRKSFGRDQQAQQNERESKAVVQSSLGCQSESDRVLAPFERRTHLQVAGEDRIGRRQNRTEQHRASKREPAECPAEKRDCRDRERHRDREQAHRRPPVGSDEDVVDTKSRPKQRDDQRELTSDFP